MHCSRSATSWRVNFLPPPGCGPLYSSTMSGLSRMSLVRQVNTAMACLEIGVTSPGRCRVDFRHVGCSTPRHRVRRQTDRRTDRCSIISVDPQCLTVSPGASSSISGERTTYVHCLRCFFFVSDYRTLQQSTVSFCQIYWDFLSCTHGRISKGMLRQFSSCCPYDVWLCGGYSDKHSQLNSCCGFSHLSARLRAHSVSRIGIKLK